MIATPSFLTNGSAVSDSTPLYDRIVKEILGGLHGQAERVDRANRNREFYNGDFSRYNPRTTGDTRSASRFVRTSLVMQRAVNSLTDLLYREGPRRVLKPPDAGEDADYTAASEWLEAVYRANNMRAKFQQADRMTHVSDVAAFQVEPSEDGDCPVRIRLWDAGEFYTWESPDDPSIPEAVAVRDLWDGQRRLRLYTAETMTEFRTRKWEGNNRTSGASAYYQVGGLRRNGVGILPFAFFHYSPPSCEFWTPGPGDHFYEMNDCVNKRLTDLFDSCRYNLDPMLVIKNARIGNDPPPTQPGAVWFLQGDRPDVVSPGATPDASYLQADPSFISAGWEDLNNAIDHGLEMIGVAPAQIRMVQQTAMSGDAIVAEQIQPVKGAEGRKAVAQVAEDALAKLTLTVGAKHLGAQEFEGYQATATQLQRVALKPGLVLHWPSLYPRIPGNDANVDDKFALDTHLTSLTAITARDNGLTTEEARDHLEQIADDLEFERGLFGELVPESLQPQPGAGTRSTDEEGPPSEKKDDDSEQEDPENSEEPTDG